MRRRLIFLLTNLALLPFSSCVREQPCFNRPINPSFVGFALSEVDTLILKRFPANDSFSVPIDSFVVFAPYSQYQVAHDTINVNILAGVDSLPLFTGQIQTGFDWQIFIPAVNRTISLSHISSENRSVKCHTGFPLVDDKVVCSCGNLILYLQVDSTQEPFSDSTTEYRIYIHR
jgi:hypothetical protein